MLLIKFLLTYIFIHLSTSMLLLEKRVLSSASDLHELAQCAAEITKHYIPSAGRLFVSIPTQQDISNFKIKLTPRTKRSTHSAYSNCSDQTLTVGKNHYLAVPRYLFSIYDYWLNNMVCRLHHKVRITLFNHVLNTIIKYIHSIHLWTLIVDDLTNDCIYIYEKFDGFVFILQANELQNIKMNTKLLSNLSLNRAKIVVIIDGISPQMDIVFQFLDDYSLREAVVLHKDKNEHFKVLSWIPDECGDLKKINILGTCRHTKYFPRKIKTHNLNLNKKCYFQLLGIHAPPFSIANGEEKVLDGIELKLLQLIVSHLNLALVYDNTHKTTKEFGLGYHVGEDTYLNSVTFMERYYTQRYTWFMLRTESHPHWSSVARVFKLSTWVCVLLSLILISTTHKFLDFFSSTDTVRYFLASLAVILNVSVMEKPQIARLRAVFFSWVMFSIAFTTVFQAFMTSFFTEPGRQHQIDTYEELEKSGMHVSILHRYPVELSSLMESFRSEFLVFQNDCGMLKFCFHNPDVACFTSEETFLYNSRLYFKHIDKLAFHKFSSDGVSVHRTLSMFITSPHLSLVNQMTKRLVEAGIVEKIVESFTDPSGWTRGVRMTEYSLYDYVSLSVFHMLSPFIYLSVGLSLSCIALVGEIIVFKLSACLYKS